MQAAMRLEASPILGLPFHYVSFAEEPAAFPWLKAMILKPNAWFTR